jgi:oligopeptide transport system permease protein
VAQIFGVAHLSMLSGFVFLGHQVGSFLGVWLGGFLYDRTGSYDVVWYIAIALGVFAALHAGKWIDRGLMLLAGLGLAVPKFVAAPLLVLLFAVTLHWLPAGGWGEWRNIVLPVIALALPNIAYCARLTRVSMLETLSADYLRAARARGFSETRLLFSHALKPALLPVIAWLSPALINVVTGSAVVEQVFGIPGMGRYFVQGALNRDYTLVLGVVLVVGALIVVINALVDTLRGRMDPRLESDA